MVAINKKIKILHILESLGGGGVEEWVRNISTLSDKERFSFKIYFCGYIYDNNLFNYTDELQKYGIEIIYKGINLSGYKDTLSQIKNMTNGNYYLKQIRRFIIYISLATIGIFQLINILRHEKFDVIHIHMYRFFIPAGLVGKLFRIPVIYTVSGLKSQYDSYQPLIYFVYRYFNSLIDIFVTGVSKEELVKYAKVQENKIKLIKGGIDLRKVNIITREKNPIIFEFGLDNSFPILLSVGRMDPEKGHIYSIMAVKELLVKFANIKLIILGDGPESENIRTLVAIVGLSNYVILPGFRKDLENFHSLSDIYLRTSIYEGINMASLSAMAYGKPVIGFDTKADTEILVNGENGVLVSSKNIDKLVEAVSMLANHQELRKSLGENARQYVYRNYDVMGTIRVYENIYNNVKKNTSDESV